VRALRSCSGKAGAEPTPQNRADAEKSFEESCVRPLHVEPSAISPPLQLFRHDCTLYRTVRFLRISLPLINDSWSASLFTFDSRTLTLTLSSLPSLPRYSISWSSRRSILNSKPQLLKNNQTTVQLSAPLSPKDGSYPIESYA